MEQNWLSQYWRPKSRVTINNTLASIFAISLKQNIWMELGELEVKTLTPTKDHLSFSPHCTTHNWVQIERRILYLITNGAWHLCYSHWEVYLLQSRPVTGHHTRHNTNMPPAQELASGIEQTFGNYYVSKTYTCTPNSSIDSQATMRIRLLHALKLQS